MAMDLDMLYFQAFVASLSSFKSIYNEVKAKFHDNLTFTSLNDIYSQRCGLLFASNLSSNTRKADVRHCEFILLSRYHRSAKDFFDTEPASKPFTPRYHIICDSGIFPFSPWCLLNVMLIEWKGDWAERLAIGLIHEDAWGSARPVKKHIMLG